MAVNLIFFSNVDNDFIVDNDVIEFASGYELVASNDIDALSPNNIVPERLRTRRNRTK